MTEDKLLLGFHWPPFNSIKHLHMHGLAPQVEMGWFKAFMFKPNTKWFKTVDFVINDYLPNVQP